MSRRSYFAHLARPAGRALEVLSLAILPAAFVGGVLATEAGSAKGLAYDFRTAFLPAARAVAHGTSPYGPSTVAALRGGTAFVYPPLVAYLTVPFTWLSPSTAGYLACALVVACVPLTLWLLDVRDWRCHGAALAWSPVVFTMRLGALSVALALGLAIVWRLRQRVVSTSLVTGFLIATKLFLWPVALWLLATRRTRSAVAAIAAAVALVLAPWSALGFAGLGDYPHRLHVVSSIEAPESYTVAALLAKSGLPWHASLLLGLAAGLAVLAAAVHLGRQGDDRMSFVLAIVAALALSPIVWVHYFALLLVPVALLAPTFGLSWLVPIVLFAVPITAEAASADRVALALALAAATLATATFSRGGVERQALRRTSGRRGRERRPSATGGRSRPAGRPRGRSGEPTAS